MKFDGKKLREKREQYGFSLQELADMCQCTKSYIHDLEKDKGIEPSGAKVFLFSRALGVPMDWFYGAESNEDIKQAIVTLANGCASVIGVNAYYDICKKLYPDFERP